MTRWAGIKNNRICLVSDYKLSSQDYSLIEVPSKFNTVSSRELMTNYRLNKDGYFTSKHYRKPAKELRVAFVGNFFMQCGISTYNEHLFPLIGRQVKEYKIFAEENNNPTNPIISDMIVCWKRGEPLTQLVSEIKSYDPDVILIGQEWGIWPDAKYFLAFLTQLSDYRIITILHSIFPYHRDKTIIEGALEEIVCHLEGGKQALIEKGIAAEKITMIPHGCYDITNKERLWNFYKSNETFIQIGFGFKYKSFQTSIRACGILKQKYPNVFFTAIFSESDGAKIEHNIYYNELKVLISELGLENNVAIIRGFQSDEVIDSYLRTNKVAVYPYQAQSKTHSVWGASGAARLSMATQMPVITSTLNHFQDLPTIKINDHQAMAQELDKLFGDKKAVEKQVAIQNQFIEENSWIKVAERYIALLEK